MEIDEPWLKNLKRAVPIAKTDFKKDGYGPIFDHYPLLELKQNEVRSIMSDIQFNKTTVRFIGIRPYRCRIEFEIGRGIDLDTN